MTPGPSNIRECPACEGPSAPVAADDRTVLYIDVDGVLQHVRDDRWAPRHDAAEFLEWALARFRCRWLTSWRNPNETVPGELGIRVPPGIEEVRWREAGPFPPFKAIAIRDDEDWLWVEDAPSTFDIDHLRARGATDRLIRVDPLPPSVRQTGVFERLERASRVPPK